MKKTAEDFLPKKAYFNINEVADYFDISQRSVRTYIDKGSLKAIKVGGNIKIPRESILDFPVEINTWPRIKAVL